MRWWMLYLPTLALVLLAWALPPMTRNWIGQNNSKEFAMLLAVWWTILAAVVHVAMRIASATSERTLLHGDDAPAASGPLRLDYASAELRRPPASGARLAASGICLLLGLLLTPCALATLLAGDRNSVSILAVGVPLCVVGILLKRG